MDRDKTQGIPGGGPECMLPPDFMMNEEARAVWDEIEHSDASLFVTGRAGTGKSTLLNYFRRNTAKRHVVLAPTGLAALHVGGVTIHSFFGFPLRPLMTNDPDIKRWGKGHPKLKLVRAIDTLIIDEVSMVRADILDAVDESLRVNRQSDLPFGGVQMIFIGDIFQLPPVVTHEEKNLIAEDLEHDPHFFNAASFRNCHPDVVELKQVFRQQDESFLYVLNRIRSGIATATDVDELNHRYAPDSRPDEFSVTLTSINALADVENQRRLMALHLPTFTYRASVEGKFPERIFPTPPLLSLKAGAQVMMVRNDLHGRWVNGSIGVIDDLGTDRIVVRFPDGARHSVDPVIWENKTYRYDRHEKNISVDVEGTYHQYPIRLAWAMTIHKSQGLTFDKVTIDVGKGTFAHGQLYVALSRCRTLEGITLRTPIRTDDIIIDESVASFARRHGLG